MPAGCGNGPDRVAEDGQSVGQLAGGVHCQHVPASLCLLASMLLYIRS